MIELSILQILYILDLRKGGLIFPNSLKNRILHARNIVENNDDEYIKNIFDFIKENKEFENRILIIKKTIAEELKPRLEIEDGISFVPDRVTWYSASLKFPECTKKLKG